MLSNNLRTGAVQSETFTTRRLGSAERHQHTRERRFVKKLSHMRPYQERVRRVVDVTTGSHALEGSTRSTFVKAELIPVTKDNVDEFAENWKKWLPKK